jgi:hypothetical protein
VEISAGGIAELYDPATGTFTPAGAHVRQADCNYCAPAVRLADGRVLFAEGYGSDYGGWAELYDPITNAWTVTGTPYGCIDGARVALLMTGKVLYAGGWCDTVPCFAYSVRARAVQK